MTELVDFFIAGAQKGGTTALASFLGRHSRIQISRVKEVHHFDNEKLDWGTPNYERLHAEFTWTGDALLRGEATPIYFYWPHAMARLKQYNPQAKLIILLRHPAFRAHSHWRMEMVRGYDQLAFEDAISATGRERVHSSPNGVHRVFSYVERGFYAGQIERILQNFPWQQTLFLRTDRLWNRPGRALAEIERFLGVGPEVSRKVGREYIVPVCCSHYGDLPAAARTKLDQIYAADTRRCAELTGIDLSDWLSPGYAEPMTAPVHDRVRELAA